MIRTKINGRKRTKPGPKTGFRPALAEKAYKMALYGLTENEMIEILEIGIHTWRSWKRKHPELQEALHKGRINADLDVVRAMYKLCLGYEYPDTYWTTGRKDIYCTETGKKIESKTEVIGTPITKKIPPDMKAIQMWLSNRSKGRWTTVTHHKVEHSGEIHHRQEQVDLSDFSTDELKTLKKYAVLQN